jgi:hypothetical protein
MISVAGETVQSWTLQLQSPSDRALDYVVALSSGPPLCTYICRMPLTLNFRPDRCSGGVIILQAMAMERVYIDLNFKGVLTTED